MANMGPQGILCHIDDPATSIVGSTAGTTITWATNTAGNATDFVRAVAAGKGVHYYGAMDAVNSSSSEFATNNLNFVALEGHCAVEIIAQCSVISHAFTFGFNDTVQDSNLPIDCSATTMSATATNGIYFVYDGTDATNKDLHCAWVVGDTMKQTDMNGSVGGQPIRMKGIHPTAAKWFYMKLELDDQGSGTSPIATFLAVDHLGKSVEKRFETNLTRTTPFCYHFCAENTSAAVNYIYLRGCNWEQTIPNM